MIPGITLQQTVPVEIEINKPISYEDRLKELELKLSSIAQMLYMFQRTGLPKRSVAQKDVNLNSDGLPFNSCYMGFVKGSEYPYILIANEDGSYSIGAKIFKSLVAATDCIYGLNKDPYNLWQTLDGIYIKDIIK